MSSTESDVSTTHESITKSHATLRYTSMRVSLFGAVFLVTLVLAHFRWLPLAAGPAGVLLCLCIAVVVSGLISYVVLSQQRDAMSAQITDKLARRASRPTSMKTRFAADAAAEDAFDDAVRADTDQPGV